VDKSQYLLGERFTNVAEEPLRRLFLRMGRGRITIRQVGPYQTTEAN
jgi:hypothetical protein